jgi:hypothetical protein
MRVARSVSVRLGVTLKVYSAERRETVVLDLRPRQEPGSCAKIALDSYAL